MEKTKKEVRVEAKIYDDLFVRFSLYDTFVRRKRWKAPALFMVILGGFSLLCFTVFRDREQASLPGLVLLSIALVLPTVWVLMYIVSLRAQAKKLKLSRYKPRYVLLFRENGIEVTKDKEKLALKWEDVDTLVRAKGCAYLYVLGGRAFLLPDGSDSREALELAEKLLPQEKLRG